MPDWSYTTLFRPLLFRLAPERARAWTLGAFGRLGRWPGGALLIRTMGHVELPPALQTQLGELTLPLPVGLSGRVDPRQQAVEALSQIGFGYLEVGPVTLQPVSSNAPVRRLDERESLLYGSEAANDGADAVVGRLRRLKPKRRAKLIARLRPHRESDTEASLDELDVLMARTDPWADGFTLDWIRDDWTADELLRFANRLRLLAYERAGSKPVQLYVPLSIGDDLLNELCAGGLLEGWDGIVLGDGLSGNEGLTVGPEAKARSIELLHRLQPHRSDAQAITATGGIREPADALEALRAGADLVQLHSGFVFHGPGLPKRVNEAVLHERTAAEPSPSDPFWRYWGWMWLLGVGMLIGGLLAGWVAMTTVLLPYDEDYLNMTRDQLDMLAPQLLDFMSHDRITLAGTMLSIGVLYVMLSWFGWRHRLHWAKTAAVSSCAIGFASYFLYLGYDYWDPLHTVAAAVLFAFFVPALKQRADRPIDGAVNLRNTRRWKLAQWGQLMFVALGIALAVGGIVIAIVGITGVFVPQDLQYLCLSPEWMNALNDRLVPLIAHDRAGFGGALLADVVALLAVALWGIQEGRRWVWWMLLIGGLPGFAAGFGVHAAIGYTDFVHLLPAYIAVLFYVAGLIMLYPYLMARPAAQAAAH